MRGATAAPTTPGSARHVVRIRRLYVDVEIYSQRYVAILLLCSTLYRYVQRGTRYTRNMCIRRLYVDVELYVDSNTYIYIYIYI